MKIRISQTVKHQGRAYAAGDEITVEEGTGMYFCSTGWAERLDGESPAVVPPPANATLEVERAKHTTKDTND